MSRDQNSACSPKRRSSGPVTMPPKFDTADIVFQEWFASGHSQKNILTWLGGARFCLRLVVTKKFLWVTSWFPFSIITPYYDLEHVIELDSLLSVRRSNTSLFPRVLLTYRDVLGKEHSLSLMSWKPGALLNSLGGER